MHAHLSILDLAPLRRGETATDSFGASVARAKNAEELGYERVWYAEHHNIPTIASSATSVLIAHVGAHTSTIRLGAGGVMLPNHAPLRRRSRCGDQPSRSDSALPAALPRDVRADVHRFAVADLLYFWAAAQFGYSKPFSDLPELSVVVVTFAMTMPMVAWMLFRAMPRQDR